MLSVHTPAKINLFLNILGKRDDGFHEIQSVIQAIGLWDRLNVSPSEEAGLHFSCNWPQLTQNPGDNLVVRAYHLFWQATSLPPLPISVHLEKGIPHQAGLGGGSSDAAAMLQILNHLSHANLDKAALSEMAVRLGSDVPFFINGGLALATGRGETITPLEPLPLSLPLIIVKPKTVGSETGQAYQRFSALGHYQRQSPNDLLAAMKRESSQKGGLDGNVFAWDMLMMNDFEQVLFPANPIYEDIARKLRTIGVHQPLLCGSGAAMLGFVNASPAKIRDDIAPALVRVFPPERFDVFRTATWSKGMIQAKAR